MVQKIIKSNYMSKFVCIGSKCEDTCCNNFRIEIDKKRYELYEHIEKKKGIPFLKNIIKNSNPTNDENFGIMKLNSNGTCSFLNNEKLCKIHIDYGVSALCNTCRYYPRYTKKINQKYYQTGLFSCPEIVRLVLLSKEIPDWSKTDIETTFVLEEHQVNEKYVEKVRKALKKILRNNKYSLSKRLWLISLYIRELQCKKQNTVETKLRLASKRTKNNLNKEAQNLIALQIPLLLRSIFKAEMIKDPIAQRFIECVYLFKEGMKIRSNEQVNTEKILQNYQKNLHENYLPFFTQYNYILDNYCAYFFDIGLFPYTHKDLPKNYLLFIIGFSLLKFILVGISASSHGLDTNIIIKLFQSFAKVFHQSPKHQEDVIGDIYNNLYNHFQDYESCISILLSE
ncbi:hypothetical protein FC694_03065 [Bacillus wiedmannii]|uniref:Lysine-N-methylase n=1 Tax=Bacillus wiedmannii TaxID=1890302 RepID=A0A4U2N3Q8_9BACI|nr:flagellin lysine-N-methylase [Bacillus wiedmannii]TKH18967.1 hypothetical protein FC694_03065 [Bacillus wiedmannii]